MLESLSPIKFLLVAANLLILYFVLRKILFKRVTEFMDNRTKSIKDCIANAEQANTEALELKQKYDEQLKTARAEGASIVDEARAKAQKEHDRIMAQTQQESEALLARARDEIERERNQMIKELQGQVAGLALAAASKVIEANMDNESNRALVERFLEEAGAA